MPRKKNPNIGPKTMQLVVRVSDQLNVDLRTASEGLGVDVSNLVRMILTEHVSEYLERGSRAKKRLQDPAPPEVKFTRNLEI